MPRSRAEKGAVGLPLFSGRLGLDLNRRLRWPAAGKIYRQMLDDSPPAAALWTAIRTLLRTDAQVTAGGKTDADKQAAETTESSLHDMRDPLPTSLHQMASASLYGFCIHETVFKRRPDGYVGWASWGLRRQETLYKWETDKNGRVAGFTQRAEPDFRTATIWTQPGPRPAGAGTGMHLIADDSDGSPEGRGALRPMYRYWYMVTQFELLAGIGVERGVGFPVFERDDSPAVALTDEQLDDIAAQAEAIRQNEQAYILLPPGLKFRFAEMPGVDAQSYLNFIQRYNVWMLATALAEFVALGTGESSGSRALGGNKIDLFLKSLTGFQDRICETINRSAIIPLCKYNGWVPGQNGITDYPRVSLPAVKEYDLGKLGSFIQVLTGAGAFHATPEDEEWLRKISDLLDVDIKVLKGLHEEDDRQAVRSVSSEDEEGGDAELEEETEDDEDLEMAGMSSRNGREP